METVALVGPIDSTGKATLKKMLPSDFIIKEILTEDDYDQLHDANYVVLRTLKIDENAIKSAPNLKLIQRWGVGYDTVDIKAAGDRNIQVAIASGINAIPVSEYAVLLMLSVYRNIIQTHKNVTEGRWRDGALINRSYTISGKMVGLIGMGNIGKQVAEKVKSFGAKGCYYDMFRLSKEEEAELGLRYLPFEEIIRTADIISLHVPLNDDTKNLICEDTLEMMKPTAIVVNTSRGGIINEKDLYNALSTGKILGAGLDVFENEPVREDNVLVKLNNVVLSAHSAGNTVDNSINMAMRCVNNIVKVSKGEKLTKNDLVNAEYLNSIA